MVHTNRAMRLLPEGGAHGRTPYVWLVYALFYVAYPLVMGPGPAWWPHLLGLVTFLALYFRGYWVDGGRRLPVIVALCVLGASLAWVNPGALSFFIYATAFVGGSRTGRAAVVWIAGITLVALAVAWMTPWSHPLTLSGVAVFTPLIGFVCVHDADVRRRNASLRLAQDEIARLAVQGERHRIAADLHDVLGHTLSVIVLKAELATKMSDRDPAAARAEMADVERIARDALATTRKVVTGIQATTLADEILRARTVLAGAGVTLDLDPPDQAPDASELPGEVQHALAMVVREAVTNILRHAHASTCRIHVAASSADVCVEISDDGVGGDLHEGNGLRGMRARLAEVGGHLTRVSAGAGTHLRASVPRSGGRV
jgi:two-component system sensor histidine kinase DesK